LKIVVESALPIVQEFDDIFLEGKLNYFNAHYYLNQNDFSSTISYIDKSIELYNLAEQTRFETQTLIDKLCVLMENESDNIDPIITKIERLIKKLKGTYGSYLFTAIKLYINSNKDNENSDDPNNLLKAIEKPRSIIPVTYPLIYWYLARTYHAIGQSDKANKCHEKAKNIITTLAEGVTDIKNIENYYNLYFHKRIGEKLS
jgi:tetratricopeptide (TPR) repeat protein